MIVKILFFGPTASIIGTRCLDFECREGETADYVYNRLLEDNPQLAAQKLHLSVNQQYATGDEVVRDGDELAIFTAVSGG